MSTDKLIVSMITHQALKIAALLVVVLTAVVHGMMSDRWTTPKDLLGAAQRLSEIPMEFADWHGTDLPELTEKTLQAAGAISYARREYANGSGDLVSITILCGRPGPLSSHAPDVCFAGGGFSQTTESEVRKVSSQGLDDSEFYAAMFKPPVSRPGLSLETYWGCSSNGATWDAISDGRVKYAGKPFLYRIFLTTPELPRRDGADTAIDRFLKDFLPVVAKATSDESKGRSR